MRQAFRTELREGVQLSVAVEPGGPERVARSHELAVMRALGGQKRQLRQGVLAEFALQGGVAGLLAGAGATSMLTRQIRTAPA